MYTHGYVCVCESLILGVLFSCQRPFVLTTNSSDRFRYADLLTQLALQDVLVCHHGNTPVRSCNASQTVICLISTDPVTILRVIIPIITSIRCTYAIDRYTMQVFILYSAQSHVYEGRRCDEFPSVCKKWDKHKPFRLAITNTFGSD